MKTNEKLFLDNTELFCDVIEFRLNKNLRIYKINERMKVRERKVRIRNNQFGSFFGGRAFIIATI